MTIHRRTFLAGGLAAAALPAFAGSASAAVDAAYVMGYFTESPDRIGNNYGLHLAVSRDGLSWTPLNQNAPVAVPTAGTGGLRDPHILRKQDGTFIVLATDLTGTDFTQPNQYIHAWDSADLTSFTGYRRLRMHSMDTHTWAPESFWDSARGRYGILYSARSGTRDAFWVNYTSNFVTVSAPQVFFDPGFDVLDGTVRSWGGVNYLYYKSFSDGALYGARSSTLNPNSFTTYTSGMRVGGIEAPIIAKANDHDEWYLWGDSFAPVNGELYVWRTGDIGSGQWTLVNKAQYNQPLNAKHPTICPITLAEHDSMLSRWGAPAWNRIKSYNFPDHLIRHAGFVGRIDPYPLDPFRDSMWLLVPGLASSSGVSLRSVNFPDRFLRHSNFEIGLAMDDGSAGFAADATFHREAGLADAACTSFRSHNFPDRYLRHSSFALRIDRPSTATDRADATFRVGY